MRNPLSYLIRRYHIGDAYIGSLFGWTWRRQYDNSIFWTIFINCGYLIGIGTPGFFKLRQEWIIRLLCKIIGHTPKEFLDCRRCCWSHADQRYKDRYQEPLDTK